MGLLDQSGVTGGGLDPYGVHVLFVNMDNMWTERFGNLRLSCYKVYEKLHKVISLVVKNKSIEYNGPAFVVIACSDILFITTRVKLNGAHCRLLSWCGCYQIS